MPIAPDNPELNGGPLDGQSHVEISANFVGFWMPTGENEALGNFLTPNLEGKITVVEVKGQSNEVQPDKRLV